MFTVKITFVKKTFIAFLLFVFIIPKAFPETGGSDVGNGGDSSVMTFKQRKHLYEEVIKKEKLQSWLEVINYKLKRSFKSRQRDLVLKIKTKKKKIKINRRVILHTNLKTSSYLLYAQLNRFFGSGVRETQLQRMALETVRYYRQLKNNKKTSQ